MKKNLLFILIVILSANCYSQIIYEKGYYIDNSGNKVDCLIKNVDWKDNPTSFEYKLTENSDKNIATLNTVKEFGVYNIFKYTKQTVNIDRSSSIVSELSNDKYVSFNEEELFLKVLVEGKASLYSFVEGNIIRYFYNKDHSDIEQLVYKKYLTDDNQIGENTRYKQQLWNDLKCESIKVSKVEKLKYSKNRLIDFFIDYNECNNQDFTNYETKVKQDLFNLNIRPGFKSSSLYVDNSKTKSRDADFGNKSGFRIGLEAEVILPFNKNKWAIIFEPTYQDYKAEKELSSTYGEVDYKSIEFPIGLRHYFFLNDNSKIFLNAAFIYDLTMNSTISYEKYEKDIEINEGNNMAVGIGYKYNDKYSIEFRYNTKRDILSDYVFWNSEYKTMSVIFGYTIF